jgi:4-amino-4-deoxy-L-arabinose transferase-like glycosyltransferase
VTASTWRSRILLGAIMAIALAVRLYGLTFGLPFVHARPDELLVVAKALGFFTSDFNPRFFDYPSLYFYLVGGLFAIYYWCGRTAGWFTSAAHFASGTHGRWQVLYIIGRSATALFGTLTVVWVYRIGAALFEESVGVLAAFFLSLSFLHVRDSHYATTDVTLTFFAMWSILSLVRLYEDRQWRHAGFAAFYAGLAAGTKYNAVLLALPMMVVEGLHAWPRRANWRATVRGTYLPLMALVMVATFFVTTPYVLLDHKRALNDFRLLFDSMSAGMTPRGFLEPGWIYHLRFSLLHGLGLPLLIASLAGIVVLARRQPAVALLLSSFPAAYYVTAGASANVFVRYMIPAVPFLCLFAAVFVDGLARVVASRIPVNQSLVATVFALLVIAPSAWSVVQFDGLLAREDSRVVAARWIDEHVPRGSIVFVTGNAYGHPPLEDRLDPKYRLLAFDYKANNFYEKNHVVNEPPDWIVVQRSALPYSHVPDIVVGMLASDYQLVYIVKAVDLDAPGNVYDVQDAFYLPYGGFNGVRRPGPNLEMYRRTPKL